MNRYLLILTLSVSLLFPVHAEREVVKVTGEADYFSPKTESPIQAEQNAILEAQLNALKDKFGLVMGEHLSVMKSSQNGGKTQGAVHSLGESDVNGEWIRDLSKPEVVVENAPAGNIYHVKVYGEAREIPQNRVDLECHLLYNGIDVERNRVRGGEFHFGDECYLYFRAPIDGWISVFLADDDEEGTMQCMLPYDNYPLAAYPVKGNKEYVFFSRQTADEDCVKHAIEMIMECRKNTDFNVFYIIFSPNEYAAQHLTAYDDSRHLSPVNVDAELMPRETDFKSFHKWLGKQRRKDADLQVIKFPVTISK